MLMFTRLINGNILIFESEKDDKIPKHTIRNYINSVNEKKKLTYILMKNTPHDSNIRKFKKEVEKITTNWFKKIEFSLKSECLE